MVAASQIITFASFLSFSVISAQYFHSYHHEITYDDSLLRAFPETPDILALPGSREMPSRIVFRQAGNPLGTPALLAVNLFTPNTVQQPAETPGQFENYMKALLEEAKEAEKEQNAITTTLRNEIRDPIEDGPRGYVRVKMERGAKSFNYGYAL